MSESLPMISVIILTYNNFELFSQTMNSVLTQDYSQVEIVIADDASSEECYDEESVNRFVQTARTKGIPITVRRNLENVGTVKNINSALDLTKGGIIAFLGCGDYYADSHVLSTVAQRFEDKKCLVITSRMEGIYPDTSKKRLMLPTKRQLKLLQGRRDRLLGHLFQMNFLCAPATFYKKDVYRICGKYDERLRLVEDFPFMLQLLFHNVNIEVLDKITVKYMLNGVSRGTLSDMVKKDLACIEEELLLPNVNKCDCFHKRLFLFKFYRKRAKNKKEKWMNSFRFPEIALFWQYLRIRDVIQSILG